MTPAYFGDAQRQLLGLHHAPTGQAERHEGVLLCAAAPQEAQATHWLLRRLAVGLAREGFHVLRFDYFGTGDSAGDGSEGSLERWRDDVAAAATELRELSGVKTMSAVGLRLGAYVAAKASIGGVPLRSLVLWEPPVSGPTWLYEIERIQQRRFNAVVRPPVAQRDELLGYPISEAARLQLLGLELSHLALAAQRTVIVTGVESPAHAHAAQTLASAGQRVSHRVVTEEVNTDPGKGSMLASNALGEIADFLLERGS